MLTNRDIDLLLQALTALEKKANTEEAMSMMLGVMLAKNKHEAERTLKERERERQAADLFNGRSGEELIILKAKLIQMRPREEGEA